MYIRRVIISDSISIMDLTLSELNCIKKKKKMTKNKKKRFFFIIPLLIGRDLQNVGFINVDMRI